MSDPLPSEVCVLRRMAEAYEDYQATYEGPEEQWEAAYERFLDYFELWRRVRARLGRPLRPPSARWIADGDERSGEG